MQPESGHACLLDHDNFVSVVAVYAEPTIGYP
jgi:hypothetical protein